MQEQRLTGEPNTPDEDLQLVREFRQKRSEEAFSRLVRKYQKRIYWTARRSVHSHEEADEITQLVFITVYEKIGQYREESKFFTWLYRIASNQILQYFRSRKPDRSLDLELVEPVYATDEPTAIDAIQNAEWNQLLEKAVAKLPRQQQLVFNLRYYQEFSYEEIAQQTGRTVGALKANYFHAVQKIKNEIGHEYPL